MVDKISNNQLNTLILIPGPWKDRKDFLELVARSYKYIFAGRVFMDQAGNQSFVSNLLCSNSLEFYQDEFPELNYHTVSAIKSIFIIEVEPSPIDNYFCLCEAISFLLDIGGIGLKVLNAGRERYIDKNLFNKSSLDKETIFNIFVSVSYSDKGVFTLGMHNFNQKNIFTPLKFDDDAFNLITTFAYYIINENPVIKDRETFSLNRDSPFFVIFESEDKKLAGQEKAPYNNLGFWRLWPQAWLI